MVDPFRSAGFTAVPVEAVTDKRKCHTRPDKIDQCRQPALVVIDDPHDDRYPTSPTGTAADAWPSNIWCGFITTSFLNFTPRAAWNA